MTIWRGTPLRSRLRWQTRLHRPVSPSLAGQLAAGPLYRCRQLLRRLSRAGWGPRAPLMQPLVSPSHLRQLAASPLCRCRQLLRGGVSHNLSRAGWSPLAPPMQRRTTNVGIRGRRILLQGHLLRCLLLLRQLVLLYLRLSTRTSTRRPEMDARCSRGRIRRSRKWSMRV